MLAGRMNSLGCLCGSRSGNCTVPPTSEARHERGLGTCGSRASHVEDR